MTQVNKAHYFQNCYMTQKRFISFFSQIDSVQKLNPDSILEIGIGNKIFLNYFKNLGVKIIGCDFDINLNPDVIGNIVNLPFKSNSFDCVCAFEIIEHVDFFLLEDILLELKRVSKKWIVISIPYITVNTYGALKLFPLIKSMYFMIRISELFLSKKTTNSEHKWEMGRKGYSKKKIIKIFKQSGLFLREEFTPFFNPAHYFFVLHKD